MKLHSPHNLYRMMNKSAPKFISFSSVATSSNYSNYETTSEPSPGVQAISQPYISPVYEGDDPILATASKKLFKKDATTRLKALNDILSSLQSDSSSSLTREVSDGSTDVSMVNKMKAFLPHFVYAYPRLALDNNRKVREQLNAILSSIIRTEKKILQPFMKSLIGYWWFLTADTAEEVRAQATACFEEAIPRKKRPAVLHFLAPSLLDCLRTWILEDPGSKSASDEEEAEKWERVTVSLYGCIRNLIAALDADQNASLSSSYEAIVSEKSVLASLQSPSPVIKQGMLSLLHSLATSPGTAAIASSLLAPAPNARKLRPVASQLLEALAESSAAVVTSALDCLLGVLSNPVPAAAFWSSGGGASVQKHIVPKLRALLKNHPMKLTHYLVPIVGALPADRASIFGSASSSDCTSKDHDHDDVDALCLFVKSLSAHAETEDDSIKAAVDVTIVEVSLLLLLRTRRSEESAAAADVHMGRVATLLQFIVEHSTLIIHALSTAAAKASHSSSSFDELLLNMQDICAAQGEGNLTAPAFALCRSLNQLQRATSIELNMSAEQWLNLLWLPLSAQLGSLISSTYSLPPADVTEKDVGLNAALEIHSRARGVLALTLAIFGPKAGGSSSSGYSVILRSVEDTAADILSSLAVNAHLLLSADLTFSCAEDAVDLMKVIHASEVLIFLTAARGRQPPGEERAVAPALEALFGCQWSCLFRVLQTPASGSFPSEAAVRQLLCSLLEAVCDSGSALPSATVHGGVSQLLQYCMEQQFLTAMNVILFHFIRQGQDQAEYISAVIRREAALLGFLRTRCSWLVSESSSSSSLVDDIHLLLAVAELSLSEEEWAVGGQLVDRAINKWTTSNKLCVWLVLNILCKTLSSPATTQQTQPQWLQLHTPLLVDKLTALFFGRVRSGKQPLSSSGRLPLPEVVVDWIGVERILLPMLPVSVKQQVFDAIASVLNGPCLGQSPSTTQMQPKKWSRHVLDCAELMAAHQVEVSLVPMQRRYWTELLGGLLDSCDAQSVQATSAAHAQLHSRAEFVLHGVVELLAAVDSAGGQMRSLLDPATMLDIWTSALLLASTGPASADAAEDARQLKSNLLTVYMDVVRDFPATDKTAFLSTLLDSAADYCRRSDIRSGFIIRKGSYTRLFSEVLQAELLGFVTMWIEHFYPIPHTSSLERTRLHSPRGQELSAGTTVQYIQKNPIPRSADDGRLGANQETVSLVVVEAKVVKVHVEAGQNAYYSIRLSGAGGAHREIQTEWHKLSLTAAKECAADEILYLDSPLSMERSVEVCEHYLQSTGSASSTGRWRWLLERLTTISKQLSAAVAAPSEGTAYWQLKQEVSVFCLVFRHVCVAAIPSSKLAEQDQDNFLVSMILPRIRGLVQHLTALDGPQSLRAWTIGLDLLQCAAASKLCVGNGFWLPAVLTNLMSSAAKVRAREVAETLHDEVIGQLLRSLSALLSCSVWQTAFEFACEVIPMALTAKVAPHLTLALVDALRHVWQHRALLQQQQQHSGSGARKGQADPSSVSCRKQRWETEAFDLMLAVFVDGPVAYRGVSRAAQRAARMDARLALHYCLLPLSRQAAIEMLRPSANLQQYVPKLQRMMDSESSVDFDGSALEDHWASFRLTACKVLDVYTVSQDDSHLPTSESSADRKLTGTEAEAGEDWAAEEAADLERDRAAFLQVMGEDQLHYLMGRFSEEALIQLVHESEGKEPPNRDEVEGEGEGEGEGEEQDDGSASALASKSPTASFKSSSSQKIGLKRKLQAMRGRDVLGSIFAWMLCMQRVDSVSIKDWTMRARCGTFLHKSGMMQNAMHLLLDSGKDLLKVKDLSNLLLHAVSVSSIDLDRASGAKEAGEAVTVEQLSAYALFRTVCTLPAMARNFWIGDHCSRSQKLKLSRFVEERARSALVSREMALLSAANKCGRWDSKELQVKGNLVSGEISATYMRDETSVEMKITLPSMYPLRNVEIIQLLSMQDGSVVDAVLMWKCNIEKEFDGVEPCPICYCILHAKSLSLPTLGCPTCRNKFHPNCLFTWFRSSGKSKCVICQQEFFY